MNGLTPQLRDCLSAVQRLTVNDVPPSYDELRVELGLASRSNVHRMLHELKERGRVDFLPSQARTLKVLIPLPAKPGPDLSPAALNRLSTEELGAAAARIAGLLSHRAPTKGFETWDRLGRRAWGLPLKSEAN